MSEEVSKYEFIFVDVVHNNLVIKAACEGDTFYATNA